MTNMTNMTESKKGSPLYLLTGLILGAIIGLLIGYVFAPITFVDITPSSLHEDFKQVYLVLVAEAYHADKDIGRAYSRISEMMSPLDLDTLRSMSVSLEADPETRSSYEPVRVFINDLQTYMNQSGKR